MSIELKMLLFTVGLFFVQLLAQVIAELIQHGLGYAISARDDWSPCPMLIRNGAVIASSAPITTPLRQTLAMRPTLLFRVSMLNSFKLAAA